MVDLSRRQALTAVGAAALTAVTPSVAAAQSLGLRAVIDLHRSAEVRAKQFITDVSEPASGAYIAAVKAIPRAKTKSTFVNICNEIQRLSDSDADVANARAVLKWSDIDDQEPDWVACQREVVELGARRVREKSRLRRNYRLPAINRSEDRLCALASDALLDVSSYPVANAAELYAKIIYLHEVGAWEFPPVADAIAADVRRLAGAA